VSCLARGLRSRALLAAAAATLLLAACGGRSSQLAQVVADPSGYSGTLLTPAEPRPELTLPDTGLARFDLGRRPAGELTVLFFGYTHCPDVCPTTMADLGAAVRTLRPAVRARVKVVFVTEDPRRDTAPVLRAWLDRFDPSFVGLLGGGSTTSYVLTQLHLPQTVLASVAPVSGAGRPAGYDVSHSGVVYVFADRRGTLVYTGGTTPSQYAADLTRLAHA
jgi:protein SCO1/2